LVTSFCFGQLSEKGTPLSLSESFLERHLADKIPQKMVPKFQRGKLERVKALHPNFAFESAAVNTDINLRNSGEWIDLEDGGRLWRLKITTEGVRSMTLLYDDFYLPEDAKFFLYTENEAQVLGAFTATNNKPSGKFSTSKTYGESVYLEYHEPPKVSSEPRISINKILQELPTGRSRGQFGFNASVDCHINVNCKDDAATQVQKRGVVRIMLVLQDSTNGDIFAGFCSGALMNNTARDQTPYLLTAFHCIVEGFTPIYDQWQFNFGYESGGCDNPATEPFTRTLVGAEQISGRQDPDFLLVKLTSPIPSSFRPYYAGWNRADNATPQNGKMIHHPCGDIKKITIDNENTAEIHNRNINWTEYTSTPQSHFNVLFDEGYSQVGASGSPIFGSDGLVYGQLHGGNTNLADCKVNNLFFGRMAASWDNESATARLRDYLDPLNTGTTTLDGFDPFGSLSNFTGFLQTPEGAGIGGVNIGIQSTDTTITVQTDEAGLFFLQLPRTNSYQLTFDKTGELLNGVTTFDLVQIRSHILGINEFDDIYRPIAADVNLSGSITTFDMIILQQLILGITQTFEDAPSWGFVSPQGNLFNILTLNDLQEEVVLNLFGVKLGDVNYSADPKK
ncbi:MAG: hypothetical protein AAGJ18_18465, partial [Bacteroidota bacterium]